jgi:hypothetical protein
MLALTRDLIVTGPRECVAHADRSRHVAGRSLGPRTYDVGEVFLGLRPGTEARLLGKPEVIELPMQIDRRAGWSVEAAAMETLTGGYCGLRPFDGGGDDRRRHRRHNIEGNLR